MTPEGYCESLGELCDYIEQHAERIYVREQIGGKHDAYALTDLPPRLAIHYTLKFIRDGITPSRILTDAEIAANQARKVQL
jgi:hypothetical protein